MYHRLSGMYLSDVSLEGSSNFPIRREVIDGSDDVVTSPAYQRRFQIIIFFFFQN